MDVEMAFATRRADLLWLRRLRRVGNVVGWIFVAAFVLSWWSVATHREEIMRNALGTAPDSLWFDGDVIRPQPEWGFLFAAAIALVGSNVSRVVKWRRRVVWRQKRRNMQFLLREGRFPAEVVRRAEGSLGGAGRLMKEAYNIWKADVPAMMARVQAPGSVRALAEIMSLPGEVGKLARESLLRLLPVYAPANADRVSNSSLCHYLRTQAVRHAPDTELVLALLDAIERTDDYPALPHVVHAATAAPSGSPIQEQAARCAVLMQASKGLLRPSAGPEGPGEPLLRAAASSAHDPVLLVRAHPPSTDAD